MTGSQEIAPSQIAQMNMFSKPTQRMEPLQNPFLKKGFFSTKRSNKKLVWKNSQGTYIKSVHGPIGAKHAQSN